MDLASKSFAEHAYTVVDFDGIGGGAVVFEHCHQGADGVESFGEVKDGLVLEETKGDHQTALVGVDFLSLELHKGTVGDEES